MSTATTTQSGYVAAPVLADVLPPPKQRGRVMTFVYRNPTIVIGGTLLSLMILMAIFAPLLFTVDPTALAPARRTREPSAQYWFGSDMLGRDVYSRVIYGARISLIVGFAVALFASILGTFVGLVSGFSRVLDSIIMRVMDGLMSIPADPAGDRADGADPCLGAERDHRHQHRRLSPGIPADPRRGADACASSRTSRRRSRRARGRR